MWRLIQAEYRKITCRRIFWISLSVMFAIQTIILIKINQIEHPENNSKFAAQIERLSETPSLSIDNLISQNKEKERKLQNAISYYVEQTIPFQILLLIKLY